MKNIIKSTFMLSAAVFALTTAFTSCREDNNVPAPSEDMPELLESVSDPSTWHVAENDGFPILGSDTADLKKIIERRKHLIQGTTNNGYDWKEMGKDFISSTGQNLLNVGKKKAEDAVVKFVSELIFGKSSNPTLQQLEKILAEINVIQKKLDVMQENMNEVQRKIDEQAFNDYRRDLDQLLQKEYAYRNHNGFYYDLLENATTDEEVMDVLKEWATTTISGSPAFQQGFNLIQEFIDFQRKYMGCNLTVFGLYDLVAFDNFAFESEGYDSREQFRALTAADFSLGMTMSYMYCSLRNSSYTDKCVEALNMVMEYFENHPVKRKDYAVCQISGAYLTMQKNMWYQFPSSHTFPDYTVLDSDKSVFNTSATSLANDREIADYKNAQLTKDEYDIMVNYFKNNGFEKKTFLQVLESEAGIKVPDDARSNPLYILFKESKVEMWDSAYYTGGYAKYSYSLRNICNAGITTGGNTGGYNPVYATTFVSSYNSYWPYADNVKGEGSTYTKQEPGWYGEYKNMTHYTAWKVKWIKFEHAFEKPLNIIGVRPGTVKHYNSFWDMNNAN